MYDILTIEKASELLGITERTLADKAREGIIPAHKFLGRWYFLASELTATIKAQGHAEPPATSTKTGHMEQPPSLTNLTTPSAENVTDVTTPRSDKKTTKATTPQGPAFNENQRGQINAANSSKYALVVADIGNGSFTYQEVADRNNVSTAIVKKVKAGMTLIDKFKLK